MQNFLVIDCTKKSAGLQVFTSEPLISSEKTSWNKIKLESYRLPAYEVQEHVLKQHAIVMFHQPVIVRRLLDNKVKDDYSKAGDIVVVPANISHSVAWDEEISFTLLFLEPEFIANVAYEFTDPDRVEILPRFSQTDTVIYGIGLGLQSSLLESNREISQIYVDSVALFLVSHLLEHYSNCRYGVKENDNNNALSHNDLRRIVEYIDAHLEQNLGLTDLAKLVDMSYFHFCRLFKQSTGVPPHQYLIQRRIKRATHLLLRTKLSVGEISNRTGFSSHSQFSLIFRQHMSVTPNKYRKMH